MAAKVKVDLTSVRAKMARSQEHTQSLEKEIRDWLKRKPYSLLKERNPDCTRYSLVVYVNEAPPFQRWSLIAADCLSNLASALDHLIYAIACHEAHPQGISDKVARNLAFPITDDCDRWRQDIKRGRLEGISKSVRAEIFKVQPYCRLHPTLRPPLAILRDLNNFNKHRLLWLVYGAPLAGNFGFYGPDEANWTHYIHHGEIKNGTEIFANIADRPAPNMKWDQTILDLIVAIWHGKRSPSDPEGSDRNEVVAVLRELNDDVRKIIYQIAGAVR